MSLAKKRILVVDDEPDMLKLMEWQLMVNGYDVLTAINGAEGFRMAKKSVPDLIILDILMPIAEINGVQMNELLKKDKVTKHIPIIFFTSTLNEQEQVDSDGNVMISKMASSQKLLSKIKQLLKDSSQT